VRCAKITPWALFKKHYCVLNTNTIYVSKEDLEKEEWGNGEHRERDLKKGEYDFSPCIPTLRNYKNQNGVYSADSACQLTLISVPEFWLAYELKTSSYYLQYQILSLFRKCQYDDMTLKRIEQARVLLAIMFIQVDIICIKPFWSFSFHLCNGLI